MNGAAGFVCPYIRNWSGNRRHAGIPSFRHIAPAPAGERWSRVPVGLTLPGVQAGAVNASDEAVRTRILPLAGMVFQVGALLSGGSQWVHERRRVAGGPNRAAGQIHA